MLISLGLSLPRESPLDCGYELLMDHCVEMWQQYRVLAEALLQSGMFLKVG